MVLYCDWNFATICGWYWGCGLDLVFQLAVLLAGQANIDKNNLCLCHEPSLELAGSFGLYHGLCFLVYAGDADPDFGYLPVTNRSALVL